MAPAEGEILPRPTPDERKQALEAPGTGWRDWLFRSFLKVWIPLGFLIVDSWVAGFWIELGLFWPIIPSLAGAIYVEYLAFQCLWYEPSGGPSHSVRAQERRRWVHPLPFGRWTAAGSRVARGLAPYTSGEEAATGPNPEEFF